MMGQVLQQIGSGKVIGTQGRGAGELFVDLKRIIGISKED